jgi:hypothetical protein
MEEVDKKRNKDGEENPVPDVSGGFVAPVSHPIEAWIPDYPNNPTCSPFDPITGNPVVD